MVSIIDVLLLNVENRNRCYFFSSSSFLLCVFFFYIYCVVN